LVRTVAAQALGWLRCGEPVVLNVLLSALSDEDSEVRGSAARSLGQLGQPDPAILSALRVALDEERNQEFVPVDFRFPSVRDLAFEALWALAGKASTDERMEERING